jgi:hypothetical protein
MWASRAFVMTSTGRIKILKYSGKFFCEFLYRTEIHDEIMATITGSYYVAQNASWSHKKLPEKSAENDT